MRLIALMPVRNEAWCANFTISAAIRWCDAIAICNHASTDETGECIEICRNYYGQDRVRASEWSNPSWDEADIRQDLLDMGRAMGGTHFAIVDADEVLTSNMLSRIRSMAESLNAGEGLRLPWLHLWRSLDQFRDDKSAFGRATAPVIFADKPGLHHRAIGGYQVHNRSPRGVHWSEITDRSAGLMHLQHVNWRRVMAKQAWYQEVDRRRWGRSEKDVFLRYGPTTDETGLVLRDVPKEWWGAYGESRNVIDVDAEWLEREVCTR